MPSEASLANLRPAWQPGESGNTRGMRRGYRRILAESRRLSFEALQTITSCMRDAAAPWPSRLRAAEVILDRAWGVPDQHVTLDGGINMLHVEFTTGEQLIIQATQLLQDAPAKPNGQEHPPVVDVDFSDD